MNKLLERALHRTLKLAGKWLFYWCICYWMQRSFGFLEGLSMAVFAAIFVVGSWLIDVAWYWIKEAWKRRPSARLPST